jgi:hypothetical protein
MSKNNDKENDDLKSMLERLIEEVRELKARIKKLETLKRYNSPFESEPYQPRKRTRHCPHCNGTGKIDDWNPYKYPFYGVD